MNKLGEMDVMGKIVIPEHLRLIFVTFDKFSRNSLPNLGATLGA